MGQPHLYRTITQMSVFIKIREFCRHTSDPTEVGKEVIRLMNEYDNQTYREGKIYGAWDPEEVSVLTDVFASDLDQHNAINIAAERLNRECSSVKNKARALGLLR